MKNAFPALALGLASVFSVTVFSTPASAEDKKAAPIHVRGSIVDYQGSELKVKTREGETIDVALADDAKSREYLLAMEPYLFPDYEYGIIK